MVCVERYQNVAWSWLHYSSQKVKARSYKAIFILQTSYTKYWLKYFNFSFLAWILLLYLLIYCGMTMYILHDTCVIWPWYLLHDKCVVWPWYIMCDNCVIWPRYQLYDKYVIWPRYIMYDEYAIFDHAI